MNRTCLDRYAGPRVKGIDIADHQGTVDFNRVAAAGDIRFCIARTGDLRAQGGRNPEDDKFARNWMEMKRVGLRRGSYQFFRGGFDGVMQAEMVLRQIDAAGGPLDSDLPPAIDIERSGQVFADNSTVPTSKVLQETQSWLEHIESGLGVTPIIYTGEWWHWLVSQQGLAPAGWARYPLWTASYGTSCPIMPVTVQGAPAPWSITTIWQYSASGTVPGIGPDVDMNYFRGSEADLDAFVAQSSKGGSFLDQLTPFASAFRDWLR